MKAAPTASLHLPLAALLAAAAAGCGQVGPLVLPQHSSPKQGYLLVDKPPPGTVVTAAPVKAPAKPTSVPTPTTPFPPVLQPSRSVLSNSPSP
jgi:predicted small lipoprotein YifL